MVLIVSIASQLQLPRVSTIKGTKEIQEEWQELECEALFLLDQEKNRTRGMTRNRKRINMVQEQDKTRKQKRANSTLGRDKARNRKQDTGK